MVVWLRSKWYRLKSGRFPTGSPSLTSTPSLFLNTINVAASIIARRHRNFYDYSQKGVIPAVSSAFAFVFEVHIRATDPTCSEDRRRDTARLWLEEILSSSHRGIAIFEISSRYQTWIWRYFDRLVVSRPTVRPFSDDTWTSVPTPLYRTHVFRTLKVYVRTTKPINELLINQHLNRIETDHIGKRDMRLVLDSFDITSPSGNQHTCLVHETLGCSLGSALRFLTGKCLTEKLLKTILRSILIVLDFLHTEAHIIHTGTLESLP